MAKKQVLCDKCKYYSDKCEHQSNLLIHLCGRLETIGYKSLDKKTECEYYQCLEN